MEDTACDPVKCGDDHAGTGFADYGLAGLAHRFGVARMHRWIKSEQDDRSRETESMAQGLRVLRRPLPGLLPTAGSRVVYPLSFR